MSLQELHIRALEQQVLNLTRDCHYLLSLLNTTDDIDWDNWEQGKQIREDLERSKDFFDAIERRDREFKKHEFERKREENIKRAREELARREKEKKAQEQYSKFNLVKDPSVKTIQYNKAFEDLDRVLNGAFSNIFSNFGV